SARPAPAGEHLDFPRGCPWHFRCWRLAVELSDGTAARWTVPRGVAIGHADDPDSPVCHIRRCHMAIDQAKLQALLGRAVVDIGANFHAALVVTGDKLGLFRALRELGPTTPTDLAKRTSTHERYVREWLSAMAAGGYVTYDSAAEEFSLSEEQALALLDADLPGAFLLAQATVKSEPRVTDAFRSGKGVGWHEHDPALFEGTERFFRPGYAVNLVPTWIPALEGVQAKLEKGGRVADVGCGHGAWTILMAKAFPRSRFVGFDYHGGSIDWAREAVKREGLGDRVTFEVAGA